MADSRSCATRCLPQRQQDRVRLPGNGLRCKWQEIYPSGGPVAFASLGRCKAPSHGQCEGAAPVLETVSIDLYIIRRLGLALRNVPQVNRTCALLDEWAERFFELDYVKEENATQFAEHQG